MATLLGDKLFVSTGYLDGNVSVNTIDELLDKFDFFGQSLHMPEAFIGANEVPYPIDFWSTPNGENVKWEIKALPSLESETDFERFKAFNDELESWLNSKNIESETIEDE